MVTRASRADEAPSNGLCRQLVSARWETMNIEKQVADYYTRGQLEDRILNLVCSSGKDPAQLTADDLSGFDEFHVGGRESTEALAPHMSLRPGIHLLDVGCGIGGPARFFAARGCQVTGIDLTAEFVQVAEALTRRVKLDGNARFRQASALQLPFDPRTFDGAYTIHVNMNIPDKAGVFREVARVLKPGARFTIFDIMAADHTTFSFPVPWAPTPATSFVATLPEYRQALEAVGMRIEHQRSRRQFAVEFMQKAAARAAASPTPVLGISVLMGEQAPLMMKNVTAAIASGALDPIELIAIAS